MTLSGSKMQALETQILARQAAGPRIHSEVRWAVSGSDPHCAVKVNPA
jgi:hypothetical protein